MHPPGRAVLHRLAVFCAPVVVAVLAYAALNHHLFGHAMPVSAAVKQSWSQTLLQQQGFYQEHGWLLEKGRALLRPLKIGWGHPGLRPLVVGLTAIGAWFLASLTAPRFSAAREWCDRLRPLAPWACYGLLSYLLYVLSSHRSLSLTPRYYALQPILGALIAAITVDRVGRHFAAGDRARSAGRAAVAVPAVVLILLTVRGTSAWIRAERKAVGQPLVNAARWIARTLPEDARIASWNAGTIAYLAGRKVVNLDGLVNSWEYFEQERHDVCGYWRQQRITHLVDLFRDGESREIRPIAPIPIRLSCAGNLELLWLDDRYDPAWSVRAYRVRFTEASTVRFITERSRGMPRAGPLGTAVAVFDGPPDGNGWLPAGPDGSWRIALVEARRRGRRCFLGASRPAVRSRHPR